jgi:hypothetical protein
MTQSQLTKLGFELKLLSVGTVVNVMHRKRFTINNITCTTCKNGYWTRSLEHKSLENAAKYIKEITFID